jgi:hypothetical protein
VEKRWYRVEFSATGEIDQIVAVQVVSEAEGVFYAFAVDEKSAAKQAHRHICKLLMREKKAERIAAKLCPTCGIEPYDGSNRCKKFCRPTENRLSRERRAKANGEKADLSGLPPEAFMSYEEKVKLSTLETVLAFYQKRPSLRHFEKWLEANIKAIRDKQKKDKAA